ncbi:MAG: hypothetical protein RO257_14770 [Candidatus Kapabacteria bacterium]|nr:hypothetical protein [Candidatus Kapabacteria bacterium]
MKLSQEIDSLYHDWVTSHDTKVVLLSFNKLYRKLKKMTYAIIGLNFKKLRNEREDLFHDMIERTIKAKEKNMINTVDFFSAWYRLALMNHLRNAVKHKKRLKMKMIITEADMINEIDISEFGTCIEDFHIQ